MKRFVLSGLFLLGIVGSALAQHDDLYFVPKKRNVKQEHAKADSEQVSEQSKVSQTNTSVTNSVTGLSIDEDTYNRRGSYTTDSGVGVSEFAMDDDGFVVITEEGDTMFMNTDTLRLVREDEDEGWVNGFEGSDSDYEYAMRIVRFRNPRYAIPVSSPLYWDVVYGGALWPIWDWNIYDDGMYAYVFPTSSNFYYWDYMMSYPFGWNPWHSHWSNHWNWHYGYHHYRYHWGFHWGAGFYGHTWCNPWYHHHYHGHHHGFYPGGIGRPGWSGPTAYRNDRKATVASTRRGTQDINAAGRGSVSSTRRSSTELRTGTTSTRSSSVRVVTGSSNRTSGAVRSSANRNASSASSVRGTSTGSNSRSSYTRQSSSRSGSSSSYNRPSSTRSSSSVSRSSSSSRSNSYSSSSRSSSYSSGSSYNNSSRSSSYSSGSSISNSSRSSGSFSGGSSRSSGGSSSRSSGGRR